MSAVAWALGDVIPLFEDRFNSCGWGSEWGCRGWLPGSEVKVLLRGRPPGVDEAGEWDPGQVTFHAGCFPRMGTVPAFSRGFAAEVAEEVPVCDPQHPWWCEACESFHGCAEPCPLDGWEVGA